MSSNFLNKAGLSYFWQKIKEIMQGYIMEMNFIGNI